MSQSRQLAAIIFIDIVGYTELMQANENDALGKLNRFKESTGERAGENLGQIIQYYGDGCVIIFKSPFDAVAFAKILQEDFRKPPQLSVRIGIHLGDVVLNEGNVFGDSVNIASRIESLGVAGAVLLSETVNNQIRNHPEFKTTSLGKFEFKNVTDPLEVFALSNEGFSVPRRKNISGKLKKKNARKQRIILSFLIFLFVAAAFRMDSTYALAYAMLGYTYARMGWWDVMTPRDAFEKMYELSKRSIELDPELAIGYAVLASSQLHAHYDWKGAKENFEESLRLDSLNPVALNEYAFYNIYSGNFDTGLRLAEKNLLIDTTSFFLIDIGYMYLAAGRPELAQRTYKKIRELYPDKVDGYFEQYRLFASQNQYDSARYYYQMAVQRGLNEKTKFTLFETERLLKEGKSNEALALFNKNKSEVKAMDKALIFAMLNKFDEMMESLETGYLERDDDLFIINTKKEFNKYHTAPRFMKFLEKLNFPMISRQ